MAVGKPGKLRDFFSYTLWPPCEKGECIFMNENGDYFEKSKSNVISMIAVL